MSGDKSGVEELYKNFGILADAGEQASQVGGGRMRGEREEGSSGVSVLVRTLPPPPLQHVAAYEGILKAAKELPTRRS